MKISIITVCYNSSATIENTFKSVSSQTYKDIEYIVIDGGSTDSTLDLIEKYKNNITYWVSESDKGLYDAMNKGISKATGDYIGILNADDVFNDDFVISNMADFFLKNSVDVNVANIKQINNKGNVIRLYSSKKWKPNKLCIGFMPPHPSIFVKREVFKKFGNYRLDFKIGADYEFLTRIFLVHKVSWKYFNLTTHRMLVGGVSSSGVKSYITITNEICKSLKINNVKFSPWLIKYRIVWKLKELIFK
ncbi:glycosyltransferase family 2 protein [Acinetobacter sp. YH16039]|uniref:glycosyltransferase family 2 protein n=1 Tax=Acinetobacter sp. YH16039 TaxID=2601184 RepID=UPI0015D3261A|nr:glycosyltransferase family 2 protein [Acinetobacter sp. YH16039]